MYRPNTEQAAQGHMPVELQKSLLEQMNNRLRETEEHIRQEIANKVSIRVSYTQHRHNSISYVIGAKSFGGEYSWNGTMEEEGNWTTWSMLR